VLHLERLGIEVGDVGDEVVIELGQQAGLVQLLGELARHERDVEALAVALEQLADDLFVGGVVGERRERHTGHHDGGDGATGRAGCWCPESHDPPLVGCCVLDADSGNS
jgi:hypothetical protein